MTTLSACGTRHEIIARHVGIDSKTLRRHFRKELAKGREDANALVAQSLFSAAVGGNITAAIFWMKTRAGWKETQVNELTSRDGQPLLQAPPFIIGISFENGGPGLPRVERSSAQSDRTGVFVTPVAERLDADIPTGNVPPEPDE